MGKKSKRPGRNNKPKKGTSSSLGNDDDDDDDVERIAEELTDLLKQKHKKRNENSGEAGGGGSSTGGDGGDKEEEEEEEWSPAFSIQDLTPDVVRQRTGFANIVGMLQFIAVCVGGDLDIMGQQVSPTGMTALEEWLLYFEIAFDGGTKKKIWDDYKKDYRVDIAVLQEVFKSKLHTVLEMQRRYDPSSPATQSQELAAAFGGLGGGVGHKQWNETIGKSKKVPRNENLDDDDDDADDDDGNTTRRRRRVAMKVPRNSRRSMAGQTTNELAVIDGDLNRAWAFQVNFMEAKYALAIT